MTSVLAPIDWAVLVTAVVGIVAYGVWKGRGSRDIHGYLLSGRDMRWPAIALSIMATQASAITFLSTPGQAYADGMRFVQFYFGLPIAMVVLSVTAVPIFHRLGVYTAYEYLEGRFDLKTRALAAFLFLVQRGLAAGLTIFAPALVLSVILGWDVTVTNVVVGVAVIVYTTAGGTRAVSWTQSYQMLVILVGMVAALFTVFRLLPDDVGALDAMRVAGAMGRLDAVDLELDLSNRYNLWSGLLGGFFLALSYFGTDQSQVQRYLTGRSVAESRMGLLTNGMAKVPMQFFILFLGAMVFVFYQFERPPVFFNRAETTAVATSAQAADFAAAEDRYADAFASKRDTLEALLAAERRGDEAALAALRPRLDDALAAEAAAREAAIGVLQEREPTMDPSDTNYVFLTFVVTYLPAGLVGLVLAAILFASMSSTSSELNALASTTVVDVYRRLLRRDAGDREYLVASKLATVVWGGFAILFAEFASRLGTLVEAVNILGSLFYGTILGIFLVAFYVRRVGGAATFVAALVAEAVVVAFFLWSDVAYLWFNLIGCVVVVVVASLLQPVLGRPRAAREAR